MVVLYPKRKTIDLVGESQNLTRIVETQIRELTEKIPRLHVTERLRIPEGADKFDSGVDYRLRQDTDMTGGGNRTTGVLKEDNSSYATAHDAASGDSFNPGEGDVSNTYTGSKYQVLRSFLYFDTSRLGSNATIVNATLSFFVNNVTETDSGQTTLHIVEGIQDDPVALNDFGDHLTKTISGGSIAFASIQDDTINTIILNSTGRGWITKAGVTLLCLRLSGDIDNSTPTGSNSISIQPQASSDFGCYLTVNYTNNQSSTIWIEGDDLRHIDENGTEQIGVKESDVDDIPVDGVTTAPISSNWAYDNAILINNNTILAYLGL